MAFKAYKPSIYNINDLLKIKIKKKKTNKSVLIKKESFKKNKKKIKHNISLPEINLNKKTNLINFNKNNFNCYVCHSRNCNCEFQNGSIFYNNKITSYKNDYIKNPIVNKLFIKKEDKNFKFLNKNLYNIESNNSISYKKPDSFYYFLNNYKNKYENSKNIKENFNQFPKINLTNEKIEFKNIEELNRIFKKNDIYIKNNIPFLKEQESKKIGLFINQNKKINSKDLYYRKKEFISNPISRHINN